MFCYEGLSFYIKYFLYDAQVWEKLFGFEMFIGKLWPYSVCTAKYNHVRLLLVDIKASQWRLSPRRNFMMLKKKLTEVKELLGENCIILIHSYLYPAYSNVSNVVNSFPLYFIHTASCGAHYEITAGVYVRTLQIS